MKIEVGKSMQFLIVSLFRSRGLTTFLGLLIAFNNNQAEDVFPENAWVIYTWGA